MEEIRGCDSASTNAIQAGLACPRQFLTAGTLPAGLGLPCPAPAPSLRAGDGMGQDGGIPAGVKGRSASWGARSESPTHLLLSLWGALSSGCCGGRLLEAPLALSRHERAGEGLGAQPGGWSRGIFLTFSPYVAARLSPSPRTSLTAARNKALTCRRCGRTKLPLCPPGGA